MAMTAAQQTDAYRFFAIAFGAAPGVTYMNQIAEAYGAGMTTKEIVNVYTTKPQFTSVYPTFYTNAQFAEALIENVVGSSASAAAKAAAKADVEGALAAGWTRGDVIYQIFNNLAEKSASDPDWGNTAKLLANQVAVAKYFTEVALGDTTDLSVLKGVLAGVTPGTDVSTPAALAAVVNANMPGQTLVLTGGADQLVGSQTAGNTLYVATEATLSPADRIVDVGGSADKLKYSTAVGGAESAFEMSGVEQIEVTADSGSTVTFDLSGSTGLNLLKALNGTGDVSFTQVTSKANIEINNVTSGGNVSVQYQDSVLAGAADAVDLLLQNNSNVSPIGFVNIGSTTAPNSGIETLNITVGGANTTVSWLNSNVSTLNIKGDKNLTIGDANGDGVIDWTLNPTVDVLDASALTGNLVLSMAGNVATKGEGALQVTTGTGNDTIDLRIATRDIVASAGAGNDNFDMRANAGNATVDMGAGNDTLRAGQGDDNINLGAGNDRVEFATDGLTVLDTVLGGSGVDTLVVTGADRITQSEAEGVTGFEVIRLAAGNTRLDLTNSLVNGVDSAEALTVDMQAGGNTVNLTPVAFSSTAKVVINGRNDTSDAVIVNDSTVNAKATIAFGNDALTLGGGNDTLSILNGGTFTADDFRNVSGVDRINLLGNSNLAQTWDITLTNAMFDNQDSNDSLNGDAFDDLFIFVERNVPQGSVLRLDLTGIDPATKRVHLLTNSNISVVLTNPNGVTVVQQSTLEFTENADVMNGSNADDVFTADSLDQLDAADIANGGLGADEFRPAFVVSNPNLSLISQLNNVAFTSVETIRFNPDATSGVAFNGLFPFSPFNTYFLTNQADNVVGDFDDETFHGLSGNDTINGGAGNDTIDGGAGNDSLLGGFDDDSIKGEAGNDTIDGGFGSDTLLGGEGNDLITDSSPASAGVIDGGSGDDTISAGGGGDSIIGGSGNDIISGNAGNDTISGGDGNDTVDGGAGNDRITGNIGADSLTGAAGNDIFTFNEGDSTSTGWSSAMGLAGRTWDQITDFVTGTDDLDFVPTAFAAKAKNVDGMDVNEGSNYIRAHSIGNNGIITFFSDDGAGSAQDINSVSDIKVALDYIKVNVTQNQIVQFLFDANANGSFDAGDSTFVVYNQNDGEQTVVQLMGVNVPVVAGDVI